MSGPAVDVPRGRLVGRERPEKYYLYQIVSNKRCGVDVDKFDYFMRDCDHLGIKGGFDPLRLILHTRALVDTGEGPAGEEGHKGRQLCFSEKEAWNLYELFHTRCEPPAPP